MHNFKKVYGQNFLKNSKYPQKIAEYLELKQNDFVIEIGPGDGSLTKILLDKEVHVTSVEIDYDLIPGLIKRFSNNNLFDLVNEDILTFDIGEYLKKFEDVKKIKITGSLPYNISKKIISKFIDFNLTNNLEIKIELMIFIVQEEVSREYSAQFPKATFLSNYVRNYSEVRKLDSIPASQFVPTPKVNGGILRLVPKREVSISHQEVLRLIRLGFTSPRKTLMRNLKDSNKYDKVVLENSFTKLGINIMARAAELSSDNWNLLYKELNTSLT